MKFSLYLILVVLSLQSFAWPTLEKRFSLTELVDIALANHPETKKSWFNTKRAEAFFSSSKSQCYPVADLQGNLFQGRETKYLNGPETQFTNYGAELTIAYLLFDFGERKASVRAAREALVAAQWMNDLSIQKVMLEVACSYLEHLQAEKLYLATDRSLADAHLIYEAAKSLYQAGLRPITDLYTSQANVAVIQIELAKRKAESSISYGKLLIALGLPLETNIQIEDVPIEIYDPACSQEFATIIALAEKQRADLLAKKANLKEARERLKQIERSSLPKINFLGQGGWNEYAKHKDSGYNYQVGLTLDIPLFRGFDSKHQKKIAENEVQMIAADIKALEDSIAIEVFTGNVSLQAAKEALHWSQIYLDLTNKSYEGSLEGYKAGLHNFFDLIESQKNLADARGKEVTARIKWCLSLFEFGFAKGSVLQ